MNYLEECFCTSNLDLIFNLFENKEFGIPIISMCNAYKICLSRPGSGALYKSDGDMRIRFDEGFEPFLRPLDELKVIIDDKKINYQIALKKPLWQTTINTISPLKMIKL
jgi:hypothetical protein